MNKEEIVKITMKMETLVITIIIKEEARLNYKKRIKLQLDYIMRKFKIIINNII
jgi:hypothetical protein